VTVLADLASRPGGDSASVFEVSYVCADGAEHHVPLAEALAVPFEHGLPVRRFTSHRGSGI
jgi:hypothetical protein